MDQRYEDGSEIHVGDIVEYAGKKGAVVFVADTGEYSQSYPESVWPQSMYPTGFMIELSDGTLFLLDSSDEDLTFVMRRDRNDRDPSTGSG